MVAVYTLTSTLHDAQSVGNATSQFLKEVFPHGGFVLKGSDYSDFGNSDLDLIYVRTGGTEGVFLQLLPSLLGKGIKHFYLLTSGGSNSLAASMEILSYLNQNGLSGEILHGGDLSSKIGRLAGAAQARRSLRGRRLGVLGLPSDWLISSAASYDAVREKLGIELVDIPMDEVKAAVDAAQPSECEPYETVRPQVSDSIPGAMKIYAGLQDIVARYRLDGFTIRCFDLLAAIGNTGCLALAKFNAQGIPAGCEGDVPALLSMTIARAVAGHTGFMANPSRLDPSDGTVVFAHCTVPFDMVDDIRLDTHFESGIGIGIRGHIPEGDVTIFKVSGDLSRVFIAEGIIERNLCDPNLCRTQIQIRLDNPSLIGSYFLKNPIGNHHIIVPGRIESILKSVF